MHSSLRKLAIPISIGLMCCAGLALAQERRSVRKLHEDMEVPAKQRERTSERLLQGSPVIGPEPSAKQNPTAIASQDKLVPKPDAQKKSADSEPVLGQGGFAADRQTEAKLDYKTGADNELHYVEVFNPSIVPFKRMSALSEVKPDFRLGNKSYERTDLRVGDKPQPGSDLFWGSILVDLTPGKEVPIPSVAPNMLVMSYETTPNINLAFSKDAADNYYVRSDESGASGTFRVVFLVQAPASYFAPKLPAKNLLVRDIPQGITPPLPPEVQKIADKVASDMMLHAGLPAAEVLNELIAYFRSFDAQSPPPNTGNIYWDLYKSQAGVCRHRSFAFMITANGLGIPTRYVTNEAHAWVEVWLPDSDWMRIDLGGAANTLNVSNASDKSMYRPRGEDPFVKPEKYEENYTRLAGDVRGLRDDQIAERQTPYEGQSGNSEGNGSFFGDDESSTSDLQSDGPVTGPGSSLDTIPEEELAGKAYTYLQVTGVAPEGYRGERVALQGMLSDDRGKGLGGLRIRIWLAPKGHDGNDHIEVGSAVSDDQGRVDTEILLPTELNTDAYEVFLTTDGNSKYRPTRSP